MRLLLGFLLVFHFQIAGAQTELKLPQLTSPVMDLADLMNEGEEADLATLAYEIHTNNGPQITILTVPDLQGDEIENFSIAVAEKWQLGSKEKDNGLLVIISKAERKVRIEVGNGIEGEITDYDTAQYTRGIFPRYFKTGNFYQGLRIFMDDVAAKFNIKTSAQGTQRYVRRAPRRTSFGFGEYLIAAIFGILAFGSMIFRGKPIARGVFTGVGFTAVGLFMGVAAGMMVAIFVFGLVLGIIGVGNFLTALLLSRGGRYGGGGFGGGGFGGGGWGGGGGGFSGGGSSGSW